MATSTKVAPITINTSFHPTSPNYHDPNTGMSAAALPPPPQPQKRGSTSSPNAAAAAVGGGGNGSLAAAAPAVEYKGVKLSPGIEQIEFDEGVYVGTVDVNGCMAGYGKATWTSGDVYEGEWLDDRMHGKGVYTWADGDFYRGDYVNGFMCGYGEMKDSIGVYTGDWVDDMRQGSGKMVYNNGNEYDGEWLAGMRHGLGKLVEPAAGTTYEGEFVRNEKEGKGVQLNAEGDLYEGEFADGKPNGRGTYIWADGAKYVGFFKDGLKNGEGCEWLANGDWIAGNFVNGEHDKQQEIHKANHDKVEDELPDDMAAALAPLETAKLIQLRNAAEAESADTAGVPQTAGAGGATASAAPSAGAGAATAHAAAAGGTAAADSSASPFASALKNSVFLTEKELENWEKIKTIGKGSFGSVFEAKLTNGKTVCVKVVELGTISDREELDKLHNEIALMKRMQHPNIVQYYGSQEDGQKNTINIFMELVTGGSLNSVIKKFKTIPRKTVQQWTYQIVLGVKYLHECGIVHRDIKGDNVLVTQDGIVKLADFGCSKSIDDVCSATHGCSTMVGTPYWMAPEVIKCEAGGYGSKSDIWSIGCTIVEMLTGRPPWPECNSMWAAVYKIANSTGLPTEIPHDVDPQLMDLLEKTFERDPRKRPTAAEMLQHPFLAGVMDS